MVNVTVARKRQPKGKYHLDEATINTRWQTQLTVGLLWYPHFKLQYVVPGYPLDWSMAMKNSCGDITTFLKAIRSKVFVTINDSGDDGATSWIGDMASWMGKLCVPEVCSELLACTE